MKVRSKWLIILSLVMVMGLLLAACAPAEETTEEPTEEMTEEATEEATEEPTEEATEEPVAEACTSDTQIRVWADDTRSVILAELGQSFCETYGVELVVEEISGIREQFAVAAPAGEGPDVLLVYHDWLGELVASGLVEPLDLGDKAGDYTATGIEGCTYEGVLYCLPYAVENMALFYNTDLVDTPPTTWDELVATGTALQEAGSVTYGMALEDNGYKAYPILTSFGGYVFGQNEDGSYNPEEVGIDSEGMVAGAQWIRDEVASGFLSPNANGADVAEELFMNGEIAFLMTGPWNLGKFRDAGIPYGVAKFPVGPAGEGRPFAGVQGFAVSAFGENKLLAQAFLTEFVGTEAVMSQLVEIGNRPSAYIPVAEATDDADLAAFGEAGANAVIMPSIPEMGSVWGAWNDAVVLAITTAEDVAATFQNAAAQIRDLIGGAAAGMVNVPGSWQSAAGFECEWDPACADTALTENEDGLYVGSFEVAAGDYEVKVALDGAWTTNFGVAGEKDGPNCAFSMAADGTVDFSFDPATSILVIGGDATSENCGG